MNSHSYTIFYFFKVYSEIETDLEQFGDKVATNIYELGLQCEREPPQLQQYDAWGNRIDKIITSSAWKKMHDISAEEGLIAIPYECRFGEYRYVIGNITCHGTFLLFSLSGCFKNGNEI